MVNYSSSSKSVNGGSSPSLSHIRRESPNSDSSSDDEDSLIATQGFKTAHINTRDDSNKINEQKNKKMKKNINDSGS